LERKAAAFRARYPARLRGLAETPGTTLTQPLRRNAVVPGYVQNSSGILILFVGVFFVLIFFDLVFADYLEFNGIHCDHLEVGAALRAGDDRPFIDLIFFDVEIRLAFWTVHHDFLHTRGTLLYLVSS